MKKRVVFVGVAIYFARYQHAIGKKLEEKGVKVSHVTYSKEAYNFLKKNNADVTYLPDFTDKCVLKKPAGKYLEEIESEYNINANLLLLGDYDHSLMSREKAFESMVKNFMFWEDYLKNKDVNMILSGVERFAGMIPYAVSKKYDVRYYYWTRAVIPNNFVLSEDQCGHWSVLDKYWGKNKNRELTTEERKEATEIINDILEKKRALYLVVGTPKVTISGALFFFKRLYLNIFVEKFRNPYARVIRIAWDKIKKAVRKYLVKPLYSQPDYNEKFFIYPLHVENDAQLLVRAPPYEDQIPIIKYISRCLPAGYKLYIKEHPNNIGGMAIGKLRETKNIPNVRLVSPYLSSHDLISKSQGVIVINSTVGWEAMLYGKPVIVLGTGFYDVSEMVWKVRDLYELPEIIKKALNKKIIIREKLLRFANAIRKSSYPGNVNFYYQYAEKAMADENISLIAKGIYTELNKK